MGNELTSIRESKRNYCVVLPLLLIGVILCGVIYCPSIIPNKTAATKKYYSALSVREEFFNEWYSRYGNAALTEKDIKYLIGTSKVANIEEIGVPPSYKIGVDYDVFSFLDEIEESNYRVIVEKKGLFPEVRARLFTKEEYVVYIKETAIPDRSLF